MTAARRFEDPDEPTLEDRVNIGDLMRIRWEVLMKRPQRFVGEEGIGVVNSKAWNRIQDALEGLAAHLVEEVRDAEAESLRVTTESIWYEIEDELTRWAIAIEKERRERRVPVTAA